MAEEKFFSDFCESLKEGIEILKSNKTDKAAVPRILFAHHDMRWIKYKHVPTHKTKFIQMKGDDRPPLMLNQLYKVRGKRFPDGVGFINLKFKMGAGDLNIIVRNNDAEYERILRGFTMIWDKYGTKDERGSRDSRNFHAESIDQQYAAMGYQPFGKIEYTRNGKKETFYLGGGYSLEDILLFTFLLCGLYTFIFGLYAMLLKAQLDQADTQLMLWAWIFVFVVMVKLVAMSIVVAPTKKGDVETGKSGGEADGPAPASPDPVKPTSTEVVATGGETTEMHI